MKQEKYVIPEEIISLFEYAAELAGVRDDLLTKPFCLRRILKISKVRAKVRSEAWDKFFLMYPEKLGDRMHWAGSGHKYIQDGHV